MKNFLSHITELFDRPFPYKLEKGGFGKSGQSILSFFVGPNDEVKVVLDYYGDILSVNFLRNGNMEVSGEGFAERILATVLEIIHKFSAVEIPAEILIISANSDSRSRVYSKMIERYAKSRKYEVSVQQKGPETWFSLSHESNVF